MVPPKRARANTAEAVRTAYFPLIGGEDLISPALNLAPGALTFSKNYEPGLTQGYRRIDGFERTDGRPAPSDASYWILNFTAGDNEPTVGCTFTGGTSAASAELMSVTLTSGSWAGNDAAGYLVLTNVSGTFIDGEPLQYSVPASFTSGFSGGFA